jgi:hypothetical protein
MKLILFCIVLAAGIAAATGCNDNSVKPTGGDHPSRDSTSGCNNDTLSRVLCRVDSAREDIRLFDSLSRVYLQDSIPIRAYTIRAVDLLDALGLPVGLADSSICQYKYIRTYLGYRQGTGFKLYIVPVKDACLKNNIGGDDVLLNSLGRAVKIDSRGFPEEQEYVLDLNAPCPKTCPDNSPFMHP